MSDDAEEDSSLGKMKEVEKLLSKLKYISFKIGAKQDENDFDTRTIQDEFQKLSVEISMKLNEAEKFLDEKDKIGPTKDAHKTQEKYRLEDKIGTAIEVVKKKYSEMKDILEGQRKNKKKYGASIESKEETKKLLGDRYDFLKNRNEGILDDDEKEKNKYTMDKLDELLAGGNTNTAGGGQTSAPEREISPEEQEKIDAWKGEVDDQDKGVERIGANVKILKKEVKKIGENQEELSGKVKDLKKDADHTEKKLVSTNKKVKDLLEKLGHDKICIDIILIVICLGLIAVLYGVIKSRLDNPANAQSAATNSTVSNKLFY